MPRNGSGTFNRVYDWTTDEANGINIEASRMDTEFDGIATALSNSIAKDGQTTITANIPFNSKKITGLANGSARTDSIALGQVQDNSYGALGTLGGSADTYTASPSPAITAYATGSEFNLKVNADNTGASTLNVSAVGAKDIKKYDGAGSKVDLEAGDLQQDQYYKVIYDGTDFILNNPESPYLKVTNLTKATTTTYGINYLPDQITISNGTDTEHDIDFTAGNFNFDDGSGQAVATALTKQLDSTFALGNNQGGMVNSESLPTDGTIALYGVSNADGSIVDFIATTTLDGSTIASDPVVISNSLTKKRKIASLRTDGSSNIRVGDYTFFNGGYRFYYNNRVTVLSTGSPATVRTPFSVDCPPNTLANLDITLQDNDGSAVSIIIMEEELLDTLPDTSNSTVSADIDWISKVSDSFKTNNSSQLYYRSNDSSVLF